MTPNGTSRTVDRRTKRRIGPSPHTSMSRLGKRLRRSKGLGLLIVVLFVLLLPVILPIVLIQVRLRTRRIAQVVCGFICVSCGAGRVLVNLIVNPPFLHPKLDERDDEDQAEQHPRHRRGVAHTVVAEGVLDDFDDDDDFDF